MAGKQTGGGYMGRMLGIYLYVGHCGDDGGQNYIPLLGGILVETYLDGFEYTDLLGQSLKGGLEAAGYIQALFGSTLEFECYDMLYHFFGI